MEEIKIKCTSGETLPLEEMVLFSGKLKKHSLLEIERVVESIQNDGFLFPIAISKVEGKNYVLDGECRYYALMELKNRGFEIPEVPVYFVKSNKETLIKNTLIATSTNHIVTKSSLIEFAKDSNVDLKQFGFSEGTYIDFWTVNDIDRYFEMAKTSKEKGLTGKEDYLGMLKDGLIWDYIF